MPEGYGQRDAPAGGGSAKLEAGQRACCPERPDVEDGTAGIVTRIWRLARHLESHRRDQSVQYGTDRVTLEVLASLRGPEPPHRRTVGELRHSSLITPGGVSQRLRKLERAGLVTRHVHPEDRRRIDVELTPAGVKLVDSAAAGVMAHERSLIARLSEQEQRDLGRLLRKLLAEFERPHPA